MKTLNKLQKTMVLIATTILFSLQSNAMVPDSLAINKARTEQMVATTMINRLEEIKNMDKSNMTRVEKKQLRKEVKSINSSLRSSNNGIYLSVGAIITIVLLLILLL